MHSATGSIIPTKQDTVPPKTSRANGSLGQVSPDVHRDSCFSRQRRRPTVAGIVPGTSRRLRRSRPSAPAGAAANSQGRKPLGCRNGNNKAPEGRQPPPQNVSPFTGLRVVNASSGGSRPWLLTVGPPGLKTFKPNHLQRHRVQAPPPSGSIPVDHCFCTTRQPTTSAPPLSELVPVER